ncbi:hypothetical protein FGF66_02990 [Chlorobaculum thiosulfatiphilum]|jgi:hypothetical protein|uniref:Uncharacterized protein n=1 Tax=Chlorobaculum thiosulfatiphilum TaxID=115852 RepID=A0A5C4S9E0_CHLTI|nr:hypothetical protein [Chlorobaculum thiosulfatiphilum]TNJ39912.1 hypothetical protein FGF66_02990 [Chlorobaculum thiosulfatiphilum]
MIRQLWLHAVNLAWKGYIKQIDKCQTDKKFSEYLKQRLELDMTLEEFGEMVFIAGFTAGEEYSGKLPLLKESQRARIN